MFLTQTNFSPTRRSSRPKKGLRDRENQGREGGKIEVVPDANGIPIGAATSADNIAETALIGPALASIPAAVELPHDVLVIADKAYDSDPLREELAAAGFMRPPSPRVVCCVLFVVRCALRVAGCALFVGCVLGVVRCALCCERCLVCVVLRVRVVCCWLVCG